MFIYVNSMEPEIFVKIVPFEKSFIIKILIEQILKNLIWLD